jgi:hypothetical protein
MDMGQQSSRSILAKGISVALIVAVLCGGVYFLMTGFIGATTDAATDLTDTATNKGLEVYREFKGDIVSALQCKPKVTVGSVTVYEPIADNTEIVTATHTFNHTYLYEHSHLRSTKRIKVQGDFTAKAGFPVDDSFSINISEDGQTVTLRHADPSILSCEMSNYRIIEDEDGYWNNVNQDDREYALNQLLETAREKANESALLSVATENLLERMAPMQKKYSFKVRDEMAQ